jgi:ectoine hydroxylase
MSSMSATTASTGTTGTTAITVGDKESFDRDGFVIKRGFFTPEEIGAVINAFQVDQSIHKRAYGVDDGQGGATEIALWNQPGEDSFGALARSERLVRSAENLLGGEVYHYHSKITMKRPGAGGTWVWHQDYGYWYSNGCLRPDMLTVAIPLTPNTPANGCLNVLVGSHLMGRLEHGFVGKQTGANPARVAAAEERLPRVAFEAQPGDVMFFHSNTLHTSAPNQSDGDRHLLLVAFNTRANDPYIEHHHPRYTPIDVLPDREIVARANRHDGEDRVFLDPSTDKSEDAFETLA